jgi:hypothetical protein
LFVIPQSKLVIPQPKFVIPQPGIPGERSLLAGVERSGGICFLSLSVILSAAKNPRISLLPLPVLVCHSAENP